MCVDDDDSARETADDLAVGGRLRDLSASPINLPENDDEENESSSSATTSLFTRHGNVRAQRLIQSIKRVKKASGGALFWEGWMVHTTEKEPLTEKRYYWRVDASYVFSSHLFSCVVDHCSYRCITMYHNETTNKFSREILLENVLLQLNTLVEKLHYFEMRTEQNIYFCGCKRTRTRVSDEIDLPHH